MRDALQERGGRAAARSSSVTALAIAEALIAGKAAKATRKPDEAVILREAPRFGIGDNPDYFGISEISLAKRPKSAH